MPKKQTFKKHERKIEQQVFDESTMVTLHKLISRKFIDEVGGPIAIGKESNVFKAFHNEEPRVLKIYRIETSSFQNMLPYLLGDPRFSHRQEKHEVIQTWVRKEFQNLKRAYRAGVSVPKPITVMKNVLVMEYIGNAEKAAPRLKNYYSENIRDIYEKVVHNYRLLYKEAELVHADASEFNILITQKEEPVLIDFGQAVLDIHPKAMEFFDRDCHVLSKFFKKHGIRTSEHDIKNAIFREVDEIAE